MEKEWLALTINYHLKQDMSKVEKLLQYMQQSFVGVNHQQRLKIAGENVARIRCMHNLKYLTSGYLLMIRGKIMSLQ